MGNRIIHRVGTVLAMAAGAFVGASDVDLADAAPLSCAEQSVGDSFNSRDSRQDFDGDGNSDLVAGIPDAAGLGAVDIHYAADSISAYRIDSPRAGTTQRFGANYFGGLLGAPGDIRFGTAVAVGDFNDDFCEDLAIGAPGADAGRGAVVVGFGSPSGISPTGGIYIYGRTPGEHFGSSVTARNGDIWVGAPNRKVGKVTGAGAVYHYRISGNQAQRQETISEASPEVPGRAETDDHFGQVLSIGSRFRKVTHNFSGPEPVLLVGEPDEDVQGKRNAGSVTVIDSVEESGHLQFARTITAASPGISGPLTAGDRFGATVTQSGAYVAIGAPGREVGGAHNAGAVNVVSVEGRGAVHQVGALTQNHHGIPGAAQARDRFGTSVLFYGCAAGFTGGDKECLAIGVPGEATADQQHSGVVDFAVLHLGDSVRLTGELKALHLGSGPAGVGGAPETGARFGMSLSALSYPSGVRDGGDTSFHGGASLIVAAPGADRGGVHDSGALILTDGVARDRRVHAASFGDSAGAAAGERYGVGAATTDNGPAVYITPE